MANRRIGTGGFTLVEVCVSMAVLAFGLSIFLSAFVVALKGVNETSCNNTSVAAVKTLFARLNAAYNTYDSTGALVGTNLTELSDNPLLSLAGSSDNSFTWRDSARFGDTGYTIIDDYPMLVRIAEMPDGSVTNGARKLYLLTAAVYADAYKKELFEKTASFPKAREAQATRGVYRTYLYGASQ